MNEMTLTEAKQRLVNYGIQQSEEKFRFALQCAIKVMDNFQDCRNELCLKCGNYKREHLGACSGCRWRNGATL